MRHLRYLLLFSIVILTKSVLPAQNFLGFQSSNYSGVYGLYTQPANVADNRLKFDLNVMGFSNTISNNFLGYNGNLYLSGDFKQDYVTNPDGTVELKNLDKYYTRNKSVSNPFYAYMNTDLHGPFSFLLSLSPKSGLAFTWRNRSFLNVQNAEGMFTNLAYEELKNELYQNIDINMANTKILFANYDEYALTYGRTVTDKGKHFLKAGATLKLLKGNAQANIFVKEGTFNMNNDTLFDVKGATFQYGSSISGDIPSVNPSNPNDVTSLLVKNSFPTGFGADLGLVYEYRPKIEQYEYVDINGVTKRKREANKYKLKAGLSVLDLGNVGFKQGQYSSVVTGTALDLNTKTFNPKNIRQLDSIFTADLTVTYPPALKTIKMNLPTAVSLQVDYNIWKNFYVNVSPFIAFQRKEQAFALSTLSNLSVTPRWENRWFGLMVPMSFMDGQKTNVGIGLRTPTLPLFPVHLMIGSNNLVSALTRPNSQSTDIHFALHIPIAFKRNKDKDYDGIKDKKDICPEVPGLKEFKGCPDKDKDGIEDSKDECPEVAGLTEFNGCPDKDGDGIQDNKDDCPEVKGKAEMNGCPDTDGDGIADSKDDCKLVSGLAKFNGCPDRDEDDIMDKDDACPDVKGLTEFKGCPDTDGDGIMDKEDDCIDVKGAKAFKGCPDADKDGLIDSKDDCPNEAGPISNKGCPLRLDTDEDGIFDDQDSCVVVPGLKKYGGCPVPDTDDDGIFDDIDRCPTVKGVVATMGCPEEKPKVVETPKVIAKAFQNLEFETGSAVIRAKSYPELNQLAMYLIQNPKLSIFIMGHTDNVSDDNSNLRLSKNRAAAVRTYLLDKGVHPSRLTSEGYGETQPIDTNSTPEGRQRNRRVEVIVSEMK